MYQYAKLKPFIRNPYICTLTASSSLLLPFIYDEKNFAKCCAKNRVLIFYAQVSV